MNHFGINSNTSANSFYKFLYEKKLMVDGEDKLIEAGRYQKADDNKPVDEL